jgi:hypothetical protein
MNSWNGAFSRMGAGPADSGTARKVNMSHIDAVHPETHIETSQAAIEEAISTLSNCADVMPTRAVHQARSHWKQFLPRLLQEMRLGIKMAREEEDPGEIVFWGVALIAERRPGEVDETLPVLIEILSLPDDQIDLLIGDLLTEMMPQALANAVGEQIPLLEGMFADPTKDVYVRWAIGNALIRLVAEGVIPRQQAVLLFQTELQKVLEEDRSRASADLSTYQTALIILLQQLLPHGADADMLTAFSRDLVEEFLIDETSVRDRMQQGEPGFEGEMAEIRAMRTDDCLAFLEPWFNRQLPTDWPTSAEYGLDLHEGDDVQPGDFQMQEFTPAPAVGTARSARARVGRNEPCPCGSGRKFKKCCGQS